MKESSAGEADLPEPRPKRTREVPGQPLPVPVASRTGQAPSNFVWKSYRGSLQMPEEGKCVVSVSRLPDMMDIWRNGYFGTITLARCPEPSNYKLETWQPGQDFAGESQNWSALDSDVWGSEEAPESQEDRPSEEETAEVGVTSEKVCNEQECGEGPTCWEEVEERLGFAEIGDDHDEEYALQLGLCEAFFLSYALGCLVVEHDGEELKLVEMWRRYSSLEPDFLYRYAVYHHLRTKGWVVRDGTPMGADWNLYKLGPPFYHSTYSVRVEVVCGLTGRVLSMNGIEPLSWADLLGLNRLNQTINKDLLIARVERLGVQNKDLSTPHILHKLPVTLRRIKRWLPGEMRWDSKPYVPVQSTG